MREITKVMINDFQIKKLGYDFMGYNLKRTQDISFHHLIVPKRECRARGLGDGYLYWNGAILNQNTSHDYLHRIEAVDYDMFCAITSEMIDENILKRLDINSLRRIRDILVQFEREHCSDRTSNGKRLIKEEYIKNRIRL